MFELSNQDIVTAKREGIEATAAKSRIVAAFDERITHLAGQAATSNYQHYTEDAQDYAQEARTALFIAIPELRGDSVGEMARVAERVITRAIADARRAQSGEGGVSVYTMKRFEKALREADGSLYEAEILAQDPDLMGTELLSAEMAYAARLSYQGSDRLDAPTEEGTSLLDLVSQQLGIPADLLKSDDLSRAEVGISRDRVHEILAQLGEKQAVVLKGLTGISPVGMYGVDHDEDLAADHGLAVGRVKKLRSEGKSTFAKRWIAAFGDFA